MNIDPKQTKPTIPTFVAYWIAIILVVLYGWLYFAHDFIQGVLPDGQPFSQTRALFLLIYATLPDQVWGVWTSGGSLPLGILDRVPYFACATVWLVGSWLVGDAILRSFGTANLFHLVERIGLASAVGLSVLSTATLWVGLLGGISNRFILGSVVVVIVACAAIARFRNALSTSVATAQVPLDAWGRRRILFLATTCGLLAACYWLGAVIPPMEFDVREYHLQAPKEFYQLGHIGFVEHNIYANMPLGAEMHALAWMSLWGGDDGWYHGALIGKVILASYACITAMILGGCAARRTGLSAGWIVACVWLGLPGIAEVSKLGLIDQSLACYLAAFVSLFLAWDPLGQTPSSENQDKATQVQDRIRWASMIGLVLGSAAACKYTAVPFLVIPGACLTCYAMLRETANLRLPWPSVGCMILAGIVAGGSWYGKNAVVAYNPVYPLASNVFGGRTLTEAKAAQWNQAHRVPVIANGTSSKPASDYRWSTLTKSIRQIAYESRYMSLLLLPLAGIGVFADRSRYTWIWIGWFVGFIALWFLITHRLERFWLPALVLPAILTGVGGEWLLRREKGIFASILLVAGMLSSLCFIAVSPFTISSYFVKLDALREDRLDTSQKVDEESTAIAELYRVPLHQRWINTNLGTKHRVLMVGDAQVFDVRVPIDYSTCFDRSLLEDLVVGQPPKQALDNLRQRGITHILVHWGEIERYRSPGNYGFASSVTRELFADLTNAGIVSRVAWPIPSEFVELYEVTRTDELKLSVRIANRKPEPK